MGLYNKLPEDLTEVDIIIAGGGSAGCIVAGRLAAADPTLSILLIESGRDNYNVPSIVHPIFLAQNLLPESKHAIFYQANESAALAGRKPLVPSGGVLGGGSSINFMLYTRGQRSDYDGWDMPGWSTDELLPFFKKLETYHGQVNSANANVHGTDGPIQVSTGGYSSSIIPELFSAASSLGYPQIADLQDFNSNNGFAKWLRTVSPDGKRQDTAHGFVHPLLRDGKHENLHVLVEHLVFRVIFDDLKDDGENDGDAEKDRDDGKKEKRARGVEFQANPLFQFPSGTHTIRARKLVVLSAGALGSPPILERSGIGNREYLEKAGFSEEEILVDLPGVGHDYQDHNLTMSGYETSLSPGETTNLFWTGKVNVDETVNDKHDMLGWNGTDVCAKLRPSPADVAALGPEFQAVWERDFAAHPNRPMMFIGVLAGFVGDTTPWSAREYVTVGNYTMYPYSRGHVHITGRDVSSPLDFNLGFFSDPGDIDLKQLVWAYKKARELMRRTTFYRGEHPPTHPRFDADSPAAIVQNLKAPLFTTESERDALPDIVYSDKDNVAIEELIREVVATTWHSLGTNKMAPREKKRGVVDEHLNVYGVGGLKVVDLSIAPQNVAANTNNTAMVIGEKGADIIARELGVVLSEGPLLPVT